MRDKDMPSIKDLEASQIRCCACSGRFNFSPDMQLQMTKCPSCQTPNFVPGKIASYWLVRPLGGGGMGSVYMGIQPSSKKKFAVKIIAPGSGKTKQLQAVLAREIEAIKEIGPYPGIVSLTDFSLDSDFYAAFECVDGTRLDELIESDGPMELEEALDLILQLIDIESFIVSHGRLYRDIKPENIIVDDEGNLTLLDFGLCIPCSELAQANSGIFVEGSPFYIPPERIVGCPEGEYSEIYSIGMLLFYMLSGKTYYSKNNIEHDEIRALLLKHVQSPRLPSVEPHLLKLGVPKSLVAVIDRMIYRKPSARYLSFDDLRDDLEDIRSEIPGRHRKISKILLVELVIVVIIISACLILFFFDGLL